MIFYPGKSLVINISIVMGNSGSDQNKIDVRNWTPNNDKLLLSCMKEHSAFGNYSYSKKCDLIAKDLQLSPKDVDKRLLYIAVKLAIDGSSHDYIFGKIGISSMSVNKEISRLKQSFLVPLPSPIISSPPIVAKIESSAPPQYSIDNQL